MKATFTLIMLLVVTYVGQGATDTFIAANTKWKFYDQGMDQGTAWRANAFSDITWAAGDAELGYGDPVGPDGQTTTVSYGPDSLNKYTTTYFRKAFNIVNTANYSAITFDLLLDDGAVVYLNGVEVYRQNMPAGTILFSTFASFAAGSGGTPAENAWTTIPSSPALLSALQTGRNVIAVEVHQNSLTSSDISFNFRFTGTTSLTSYISANNVSWKYLDTGMDQGTTWRATAFNDAAWASGNAELGYGDNDEETVVSYGGIPATKYITTYFRKAFTISSIPSALSLDLVCDDGAVVYLNGVEVYRQNMPAGTILFSTLASAASGDPGVPTETAWTAATLNPASLVVGNNVIAVEIHQNLITSSDISFNLRLTNNNTSGPTPVVTRGAYLQMLAPNSITIRWQTDIASNSKVDFGTTMSYGTSTSNATNTTEHEVQLTGLTANTKYFYRIGTSTTDIQGDANNFFKTGVSSGSSNFKVWVTGDYGVPAAGFPDQIAVRNAYQTFVGATPADFWLWLGDNAYPSGTASDFTSNVFGVHTQLLKSLPFFPSPGNHDYADNPYQSATTLTTTWAYFDSFTMPTTAQLGGIASATEKYYSYDYGNAHFVVLDTWGANTNAAMYNWLQSDLQANTKKFVVCYFHNPPYTKGTHDSDNSSTDLSSFDVRQYIIPILEANNVDLVLSGHSHVYERSYLLRGHTGLSNTFSASTMVLNNTSGNVGPQYYKKYATGGVGTVYIVCGNSGQGGVVHQFSPWPHPAMSAKYLESTRGSVILDFTTSLLTVKFLDINGVVQDDFKIYKEDCPTVGGIQSQLSGDWTNTLTWGCGVVPSATTNATVNQGHTVTINGITPNVKTLTEKGTLQFLLGGKIKVNN
jgi:Calcineurin-like phosphoesterase/Purple acid Phosphatase, N-terminal domain